MLALGRRFSSKASNVGLPVDGGGVKAGVGAVASAGGWPAVACSGDGCGSGSVLVGRGPLSRAASAASSSS